LLASRTSSTVLATAAERGLVAGIQNTQSTEGLVGSPTAQGRVLTTAGHIVVTTPTTVITLTAITRCLIRHPGDVLPTGSRTTLLRSADAHHNHHAAADHTTLRQTTLLIAKHHLTGDPETTTAAAD
jgi:hypothetical protein